MTECQRCTAPTQTSLCNTCTNKLRETLDGLPTWLEYLEDAVNGQTRLGQSARRSTDKGSPMLHNPHASQLHQHATHVLTAWMADTHTPVEHQESA